MIEVKKKLLLVDDSQMDLDLSTSVFEKTYAICSVSSSSRAIEAIEAQKPDLVLLDVVMPEMNGNQLLKLIRAKWSAVELPVIMATGKSDASDVIESLTLGANDFVTKPLEFSIVARRIETHLALAALSQKMVLISELSAISAVVTTYNHELNNPLSIAIGLLQKLSTKYPDEAVCQDIDKALWRVADIIKKIKDVLSRGSVEYERYATTLQMLKLDQKN